MTLPPSNLSDEEFIRALEAADPENIFKEWVKRFINAIDERDKATKHDNLNYKLNQLQDQLNKVQNLIIIKEEKP